MSRKPPRRLLVLYGSQTGTAQDVAEGVARQARRRCLDAECLALDDYPRAKLPMERLVVFVVATAGDGEVPDNMREFWLFLRNPRLPKRALATRPTRFAVFGLGDSTYEKYNAAARMLHARLVALGASPLPGDAGLAGADACSPRGTYGDASAWITDHLWPAVLSLHPLPAGFVVDDSPRLEQPRFEVVLRRRCGGGGEEESVASVAAEGAAAAAAAAAGAADGTAAAIAVLTPAAMAREGARSFYAPPATAITPPGQEAARLAAKAAGKVSSFRAAPVLGRVLRNVRETAEGWEQDVRRITISLGRGEEEEYRYRAGDVSVIWPDLSALVDAERCARWLGLDPDDTIESVRPPQSSSSLAPPGKDGKHAAAANTGNDSTGSPFPTPCTVREALLRFVDVASPPRKHFFSVLSHFCARAASAAEAEAEAARAAGDAGEAAKASKRAAMAAEQRQKCIELCSRDGHRLWLEYCMQERRSAAEVLRDFSTGRLFLLFLCFSLVKLGLAWLSLGRRHLSTSLTHSECRVKLNCSPRHPPVRTSAGDGSARAPERVFNCQRLWAGGVGEKRGGGGGDG